MAIPQLLCLYLSYCVISTSAQSLSANTPVPPLQWINLSPLLRGSTAPPPLRDASLGYNEASRSLIVFGGESEGGFVQSQTYLLNMDTLTWSVPTPPVNLVNTPPARSSAISAVDIAASNRHAFIVVGGKGSNNVALSDVWAFDFTSQFWSQVSPTTTGPAPRWGASGGIDIRVPPVQDAVLPGPNNTIYLAGGFDGNSIFPLSDVWRLNISGTLSANLPDSVMASWDQITLDRTLPSKIRQGGGVIGQQIVSFGGCNTTVDEDSEDALCALQDSYVVDLMRRTYISPGPCPVPRLDPVLVGNFNSYSTNFASQVFLLLGIFNDTIWDDGDELRNGEIDILDAYTGAWSRIMPSGDPGNTGIPTFPTPREGSAAFSYDRALVGTMRNGISDTIIFGGRDASGLYLSEMWLLRSYQDSLASSEVKWSGYGDGNLQTGVGANGSGVVVQYLTTCPIRTEVPSSPHGAANPTPSQPITSPRVELETGLIHKLLTSLSLALLLLSFSLLRCIPFASFTLNTRYRVTAIFVIILTLGSYAIGFVGFISSFTSLRAISTVTSERSASHLSTPHGASALAFFLCLYCVVPVLLLASAAKKRLHRNKISDETGGLASDIANEKPDHAVMITQSPSISGIYSPPGSPRLRTQSATHPSRSVEGISTDEESTTSGPPRRGFEVLNRPSNRVPKQAETWASQPIPSSRSLGDIDWLLRRRSLNAVGELDYTLSLAHNAQRNSVTTAGPTPSTLAPLPSNHRGPPSFLNVAAYVLTQIGFLGLNIITLVALWNHAPRALFIVFLIWVALFYALSIFIPRRFETERYLLLMLSRRNKAGESSPHQSLIIPPPQPPSPAPTTVLTPPGPSHGPYLHQPPFVRTTPGNASFTSRGPLSVEEDDEGDDEMDEAARQRMIEEEMDRRDVSIITMPKRKLWVANPS